jgi:hypothetical protein
METVALAGWFTSVKLRRSAASDSRVTTSFSPRGPAPSSKTTPSPAGLGAGRYQNSTVQSKAPRFSRVPVGLTKPTSLRRWFSPDVISAAKSALLHVIGSTVRPGWRSGASRPKRISPSRLQPFSRGPTGSAFAGSARTSSAFP